MSEGHHKASVRLINILLWASGIMLLLLAALLVILRQRESATQGAVVQNADVYQGTIIDPSGQLRITYSFGTETDALTNSIRQAVQQSN
jgi:hypothetical protein